MKTEDRIDQYRELAKAGMSMPEAAKHLGKACVTVYGFAKKHDIRFRRDATAPQRFDRIDELRRWASCGLRPHAIAKRMKCNHGTIKKYARLHGIEFGTKVDRRSSPKKIFQIPKGQAVRLSHPDGHLHLSGQTVTQRRVYSWRGTYEQARAMIEASPVNNLSIVMDR